MMRTPHLNLVTSLPLCVRGNSYFWCT